MGVGLVLSGDMGQRRGPNKASGASGAFGSVVVTERDRGSRDGLAANLGAKRWGCCAGVGGIGRRPVGYIPATGAFARVRRHQCRHPTGDGEADGMERRGGWQWLAMAGNAAMAGIDSLFRAQSPRNNRLSPPKLSNCACQLGSKAPKTPQSGSSMGSTCLLAHHIVPNVAAATGAQRRPTTRAAASV